MHVFLVILAFFYCEQVYGSDIQIGIGKSYYLADENKALTNKDYLLNYVRIDKRVIKFVRLGVSYRRYDRKSKRYVSGATVIVTNVVTGQEEMITSPGFTSNSHYVYSSLSVEALFEKRFRFLTGIIGLGFGEFLRETTQEFGNFNLLNTIFSTNTTKLSIGLAKSIYKNYYIELLYSFNQNEDTRIEENYNDVALSVNYVL